MHHRLHAAFSFLFILTLVGMQTALSQSKSAMLPDLRYPEEKHLVNIRQLTFDGENAEAYLSFDETKLVFQRKERGTDCDQIFTMTIDGKNVTRVSNGKGRTTCAYWLPGDKQILFSSTHSHADGCLEPPDRSKGYVWKLYPEFDIHTTTPGSNAFAVLSATSGYDAEATISPRGDKIVFTSTRDGDPEVYTMNIDGSDVKRLTHERGYDGGAFFSLDGSMIVFRASRPKTKEDEAAYKELVASNLVRPTSLEIHVMNADGSNIRKITGNSAANFGPFFHPDGKRIIFSSNLNASNRRNFDLYMINVDGTGLERITYHEEFDGFPMFTRDGKKLVFCSNRNNAQPGETNVFIADWVE